MLQDHSTPTRRQRACELIDLVAQKGGGKTPLFFKYGD